MKKRILAVLLSLTMVAGCFSGIQFVSSATDTTVKGDSGITLFDDFEDSTHSAKLWNSTMNTEHILKDSESGNSYWSAVTKAGVITPATWTEGDKPTKVSFDVLPTALNEWSADFRNLAVYFLYSDEAYTAMSLSEYGHSSKGESDNLNLVLVTDDDVNTNNNTTSESHTKINTTGFTLSKLDGTVYRSGSSYGHWLQYNKILLADGYIRIVAEYDWSQWEFGIVTIKYTASDADGEDSTGDEKTTTYTWSYQYTYFATDGTLKPETFKVGFESRLAGSGYVDNVCIETVYSELSKNVEAFEENYANIVSLELTDVTTSNAATVKAAYVSYLALSKEEKAMIDAKYDGIEANLKAKYNVALYTGTAFDDFENAYSSGVLWNHLDSVDVKTDEASGNGYWSAPTTINSNVVTPVVWEQGDKPTKVSFDVLPKAVIQSADFKNMGLYFLYSEQAYTAMSLSEYGTSHSEEGKANIVLVADTDVSTNTDTENHTAKINETGFTMSLQPDSAAVRRSGSSYGHWLQYNNIALADGYLRIIAEYDWSKWDTDGIVNIKYTISDADGLDSLGAEKTTSYTWNYQYTYFTTGDSAKPETFKVGFTGLAASVGYIDNVYIETVMSQAEAFRIKYKDVLALESYASEYKDAIREAVNVYNGLNGAVQTELVEEGAKLAELVDSIDAGVIANWGGYDDFSDDYKTSLIWQSSGTSSLKDYVSDEEIVSVGVTSDKYTLAENVWASDDKPLKVSFVADSAAETKNTILTGLKFYLLDSDNADAVLNIGIISSGSGIFYGPWRNPNVTEGDTAPTGGGDASTFACTSAQGTVFGPPNSAQTNRRGWWLYYNANNPTFYWSSDNGPIKYTAVYDWANWDEGNTVSITITAEDADGSFPGGTVQKPKTVTLTYDYTGATETKPTGFNIGFENLSGNATVDDVYVVNEAGKSGVEFETTYAETLAYNVDRYVPYDKEEIKTMLDAYDLLEGAAKNALSKRARATITALKVAVEAWDTTNDASMAESFRKLHGKPSNLDAEWDVESAWNVYNRLTQKQKALLETEYDQMLSHFGSNAADTITVGWIGTIPSGLNDAVTEKYTITTFSDNNEYDIIVVDKVTSETEIHSYLRRENSPFIVITTSAETEDDAKKNLSLAMQYGLAYIDVYAYTNGGGTNLTNVYQKAIVSLTNLFALDNVKGFSFDESKLNSFLTPQLFSATIKNETEPTKQGLGFKTNINEYQKTGTSIVAYGTIFARYNKGHNYDDMTLESVASAENTRYFKASIEVTDDSDLYGNSYIAGVNLHNNNEFSKVYIARSFIQYADGSVYYSVNTRTDLESSLANRVGVVNGYACRALTGVAKNMVIALHTQGADISTVGTYDSETGNLTYKENVINNEDDDATNDAKPIFELICAHKAKLDGTASTVYLASTGSDDNLGTESSPYQTLGKALAVVPDGGIIKLQDDITLTKQFVWKEHNKSVTITGASLDCKALQGLSVGDDVKFDDITLKFARSDEVFANGHTLEIGSKTVISEIINIYGGSEGADTEVSGTKLIVNAGSYYRIYGGSKEGTVNGNTEVYVGGTVNNSVEAPAHNGVYRVYAGGYNDTITGNSKVVFSETAKTNYLYGGSEGSGASIAGNATVQFDGGAVYSVYGGHGGTSDSGVSAQLGGTIVNINGGTMAQVFGGSDGANIGTTDMHATVLVSLSGGTITRRVYGGCYNDYSSLSWQSDAHVVGSIELIISKDVDINFTDTDNEGDLGIYACSRWNSLLIHDFDDEDTYIQFTDKDAWQKYNDKLGSYDTAGKTLMSGVEACDESNAAEFSN